MKKYSVYVKFKNGKDFIFETDTDVRQVKPRFINGANFIVTEDEYVINVDLLDELNVARIR